MWGDNMATKEELQKELDVHKDDIDEFIHNIERVAGPLPEKLLLEFARTQEKHRHAQRLLDDGKLEEAKVFIRGKNPSKSVAVANEQMSVWMRETVKAVDALDAVYKETDKKTLNKENLRRRINSIREKLAQVEELGIPVVQWMTSADVNMDKIMGVDSVDDAKRMFMRCGLHLNELDDMLDAGNLQEVHHELREIEGVLGRSNNDG